MTTRQRVSSSLNTLGAAASFLQDQGLQVKTEEDLKELVEAGLALVTLVSLYIDCAPVLE